MQISFEYRILAIKYPFEKKKLEFYANLDLNAESAKRRKGRGVLLTNYELIRENLRDPFYLCSDFGFLTEAQIPIAIGSRGESQRVR